MVEHVLGPVHPELGRRLADLRPTLIAERLERQRMKVKVIQEKLPNLRVS